MPAVSRLRTTAAIAVMLLSGNGCAALSLLDQTHTHHHYYDSKSSDVAVRVESLERRLAQIDRLEQTGVTYSSHETPE